MFEREGPVVDRLEPEWVGPVDDRGFEDLPPLPPVPEDLLALHEDPVWAAVLESDSDPALLEPRVDGLRLQGPGDRVMGAQWIRLEEMDEAWGAPRTLDQCAARLRDAR